MGESWATNGTEFPFAATDHDDEVLGARISGDLMRLHDEQMTACPGRSIVQAERGWACEGCQWTARIADLTTPYSRTGRGRPMAEPKVCLACGKDIEGRPINLRPPDPRYALCKPCGQPTKPTAHLDRQGSTRPNGDSFSTGPGEAPSAREPGPVDPSGGAS
jgi:hypothetical protein